MFIISIRGERLSDLKYTQTKREVETQEGLSDAREECPLHWKDENGPPGNQRHQEAGLSHRGKATWVLESLHPGKRQW